MPYFLLFGKCQTKFSIFCIPFLFRSGNNLTSQSFQSTWALLFIDKCFIFYEICAIVFLANDIDDLKL